MAVTRLLSASKLFFVLIVNQSTYFLIEIRCHKSGLYACKKGLQCVSRMSVCDGHKDCNDGSDEKNCRYIRKQHPEPRGGRRKFVSSTSGGNSTIKDRKFSWKTKPDVVTKKSAGKQKQLYFDHEKHFEKRETSTIKYVDFSPPPLFSENLVKIPRLNVKVYPEKQMIHKFSDVTIQCRDEGMMEIKWISRKITYDFHLFRRDSSGSGVDTHFR